MYDNFMNKILDDYNTKYKVVSENGWEGEYKLLDYLSEKKDYKRVKEITEVYKRIFFMYKKDIRDNLPFCSENDIKELLS